MVYGRGSARACRLYKAEPGRRWHDARAPWQSQGEAPANYTDPMIPQLRRVTRSGLSLSQTVKGDPDAAISSNGVMPI